jgi:hypothetical protein
MSPSSVLKTDAALLPFVAELSRSSLSSSVVTVAIENQQPLFVYGHNNGVPSSTSVSATNTILRHVERPPFTPTTNVPYPGLGPSTSRQIPSHHDHNPINSRTIPHSGETAGP